MLAFTATAPWLDPWWIGIAIGSLDVVAIARALLRGHGVASTLAWILGILAFPGVGAVAYLLLANPSIRRTVRRRDALCSAPRPARAPVPAPPDARRRILRLASEVSGAQTTGGNDVELLAEDEEAFRRIESELRSAKDTIWAEYYIVRNDETGHRFLDLLAERARDGVHVRLLYDALGSLWLDAQRIRTISEAGARVEPFLPMNPLRRRWAVHLRNHRKLVIVDGETVFTGGMNIGDEYSGRSRRRGDRHFRDTHLRLRGPAVREFAEAFADDWHFATGESLACRETELADEGSSVVCPVLSGPDQNLNASAYVYFAGIMAARETCFLTTPYFVPDDPTVRALTTAAKSGVDVRILLPSQCDVLVAKYAARSYYPGLLAAGVRVFEYRPSMLHAKTMVVDGELSFVGSANVDMRSFRLNFEVGALVVDSRFAAELTGRFREELEASDEISEQQARQAGLGRLVAQGAARLLSPLL